MNDAEGRLSRELTDALLAALTDALADARRRCPREHFYAYVLYTLPSFDYAILLCNTEEGLARLARDNQERDELRWSPADWECAEDAEASFEHVNDVLRSLVQFQGHEELQCDKRRKVFLEVLKLLDTQQLFGTGVMRESAVLNIMWGDQDVRAHVESARELNPRASYLAYARYELPSLVASAAEIERSKSVYKDEALARIQDTIAQVENDLATEGCR